MGQPVGQRLDLALDFDLGHQRELAVLVGGEPAAFARSLEPDIKFGLLTISRDRRGVGRRD